MSLAYNQDFSKLPGLTTGSTTNSDNPFEPFFGPVSVQDNQNVRAEDVYSHETYNLPKAYEGKNLHLGDIMDFLITRTDDWYTSRVLPWRMTDQLSVTWNIFRFNKTMADLEPHQGVPRYVTAETEARSDRLVRRGLAFIIEHGFFSTAQGRKHYMMNLEQITSAVHETCFFGVLHSLLAGKNHYKEWQRQFGRRVSRIGDLLSLDRHRWAICQKTERGLYLLDAEMKDAMKYTNVYPDTWIFPSKMSIYVSMVPSTEVSYEEVGRSTAVADNNSISKAPKKLLTFRGCTVHETRPFDMDFSGEPSELLRREKMIGSYATLLPHTRPCENSYTTNDRNIYIYNMELDRYDKVNIEDCIDNCFRWAESDKVGYPHPAHGGIINEYGIPSFRDVSLKSDPMFCHARNTSLDSDPDAIVKVLGDLPLNHFTTQDVRDWICSVDKAGIKDAKGLQDIGISMMSSGSSSKPTSAVSASRIDGSASTFSTTMEPSILSVLNQAWDPLLVTAYHGDAIPSNYSMPSRQELKSRYESEFPQTWQNLIKPADMTVARKHVLKTAQRLSGDELKTYLSKVNDEYANVITDRVLANRSSFVSGGLLEQVQNEMVSPTKGRRTAAQKKVKQFIENFETTVEYFKRENPELQDNAHVLREILRDYIQPLPSMQAEKIEQNIEAAVMDNQTITPDMLKKLRDNLSKESQQKSLSDLLDHMESAAASMKIESKPGPEYRYSDESDPSSAAMRVAFLGDKEQTAEFQKREGDKKLFTQKATLYEAFLKVLVTRENLKIMAEHNIIIPFGFMVCRPFKRYDMCSAILCKSGSQLGNTYMGHNDFQLTDDIIHKVHVGHYTFYSKSIIHDEKQYQIAEDVFGVGYKGGENMRMYDTKGELMDDIHAESFRASIICMMIPYRTNNGSKSPVISNPVDITGTFHPVLYADSDIPEGEIVRAQHPSARYYAEFLELKQLTSYASDATEHFMSPFKYLNTVMFQEQQYMYNPKTQSFSDKILNTGHWGNTYNGCGKVRNGENAFLKEEVQHTPIG